MNDVTRFVTSSKIYSVHTSPIKKRIRELNRKGRNRGAKPAKGTIRLLAASDSRLPKGTLRLSSLIQDLCEQSRVGGKKIWRGGSSEGQQDA